MKLLMRQPRRQHLGATFCDQHHVAMANAESPGKVDRGLHIEDHPRFQNVRLRRMQTRPIVRVDGTEADLMAEAMREVIAVPAADDDLARRRIH